MLLMIFPCWGFRVVCAWGPGYRKGKLGVSGTSRCSLPPLQTAFSLFQCEACTGHVRDFREPHTIRCGIINVVTVV